MTKLIKYPSIFIFFGLLLTTILSISCSNKHYAISKIKIDKIAVNESLIADTKIDSFILPYRNHINTDLDHVISYCPETLDKSKGKWQTTIGNMLADATLSAANELFLKQHNKSVDICLMNHGGIRAILPKGNVTTRNAFEIMPFENSLHIVALKGEQIKEMVEYFIAGKKPHPIAGITIVLTPDEKSYRDIYIQNKPLDLNKTYFVATSDYLVNGGDNMTFFTKNIENYDMQYKLRNLFIDYFKKVDTIPVITDLRITTVVH